MTLVKPVMHKKAAIKATQCIYIGEGKAVVTDLETMVITDMPGATEPLLLPYYSIADTLKFIPGSKLIIEPRGQKMVALIWDEGSASYPTEDVQTFPVLPELMVKAEGDLDGDSLVTELAAALPYASEEDSKPILKGVTLTLGNPIEIAASNGMRMAHRVLPQSFPVEEKVIIPSQSVGILGYVFTKTPRTPPSTADSLVQAVTAKRPVHTSLLDTGKIRFDFGKTSVIIKLVQGQPPNFISVIPKGDPTLQSQIFAPQLEAAVKRARAIAKDSKDVVRMVFAGGKLTLSAYGGDQELTTTMDTIITQGEPGKIAMPCTQLLEFLAGKTGIITFSIHGDNAPVVLESGQGPRILISPMAVQWDGDKPPAETPAPEPVEENPESPEDETDVQEGVEEEEQEEEEPAATE